jgi:DHA1 family tetracycline resistance protein-like MFS transporter
MRTVYISPLTWQASYQPEFATYVYRPGWQNPCGKTCWQLMPVEMRANNHALPFVLITIFIDSIGFGLIMPVLPRLLMRVGGLDVAGAISVAGWMGLAMALAAFFAAPVLGGLSDAYGRRRVLLIALAGLVSDYLLLAFANTLPLVFLGRVLSGLFGGSYAPAQAAIADFTAPADRARNFGLVSAAFGVGFVAGPALGGLMSEWGTRAPFIAAAVLAGINFIYGTVLFPDTLKPESRRPFKFSRANPLGAWRALRATPGMLGIASVLLLWQLASLVYPMTWSFWAIAQLGWSDRLIGLSLAAVGIVIALSQTFLTGPLVKRLGERDAASIGLAGAVAGFVGYALTHSTWLAFALMGCIGLQSLVQPSLMAMLSRRATAETQGETQGIASMTMGIGNVIAPLVLTVPLAWLSGPSAPVRFTGAAFAVAAMFGIAALAMLRRLPKADAAVSGLHPSA